VFNLQIDFIDESIRELLDVSMISLVTKPVRKWTQMEDRPNQNPCTKITGKLEKCGT
jgi:hypothetical protein